MKYNRLTACKKNNDLFLRRFTSLKNGKYFRNQSQYDQQLLHSKRFANFFSDAAFFETEKKLIYKIDTENISQFK